MVLSVVGVHAGFAAVDVALSNAVHHRAVRIFDVPCQIAVAVKRIFRRPPDGKLRGLAAVVAHKDFLTGYSVSVQLVGAVTGGRPEQDCQGYS